MLHRCKRTPRLAITLCVWVRLVFEAFCQQTPSAVVVQHVQARIMSEVILVARPRAKIRFWSGFFLAELIK